MQTSKFIKIMNQLFEVSYPNVGQKLQIENVKLLLTDNNYGDLARSRHTTALELLDLVDAVAYFSILIPEIKSTLNLADFLNMDAKRSKAYVKAFKKEFTPWFDAIEEELNKEDSEEDEQDESIQI